MQVNKGAQYPEGKISAVQKIDHGIRMEGPQVAWQRDAARWTKPAQVAFQLRST